MTPRKYEQADRLIQWAYLFEELRPAQTSTCALFWRSVVLSPLKLLGCGMLIAFFLSVFVVLPLASVAPEWFPEAMRPSPRRSAPPFPWLWLGGGIGGVVLVGWLGEKTGLWGYLHSFCYPVEIEGGLVQKGRCPSCVGRIVVVDDTRWECRRCKGHFVPPTTLAESVEQ